MQNIKNWENILKGDSKTLEFTANKQTKELVDLIFNKFHALEENNDYIYFSSHGLQNCVKNIESIKLLIILKNEGIISDIHLPIDISSEREGFVDIKNKGKEYIYLDPEAITETILRIDTMEKLGEFKDNFARFKMLDWKRFLDKRNKIYIDLNLGHKLVNKKDLLPRLKFNPNSGILSFDGKNIKLRVGDNQYYLCKIIFEAEPMEKIAEDDILEIMGSTDIKNRKAYKAMLNINEKIESKFNIEGPIEYSNAHFWRKETDI